MCYLRQYYSRKKFFPRLFSKHPPGVPLDCNTAASHTRSISLLVPSPESSESAPLLPSEFLCPFCMSVLSYFNCLVYLQLHCEFNHGYRTASVGGTTRVYIPKSLMSTPRSSLIENSRQASINLRELTTLFFSKRNV